MAKVDEKVLAFVENEMKKNPEAKSRDLFEKAKKKSRKIGQLSVRQFHALYPLQIRRKQAPKRGRKTKAPTARKPSRNSRTSTADTKRDAVRGTLMQFATDLTAADGRADLVKLLAGVDKYVDQIMKATR